MAGEGVFKGEPLEGDELSSKVSVNRECAALGRSTGYYREGVSESSTWDTFSAVLGNHESSPVLDPTGLIEIINRGYCFGTRTLVQGIRRCPAAAKLLDGRLAWIPLAGHGEAESDTGAIARELFERLSTEMAGVCRNRSRVGLLLSGGMDSRIAACVVSKLQREGRFTGTVIALTWGLDESRDVVYAKRVAGLFGWERRHFRLTPERLARNISVAGARGAEYSPVHLHAMPEVGEQTDLDIIIAASFGDSVGRAEFSGSHIRDLKPISRHVYNRFKLLHGDVFKHWVSNVYLDAELYEPIMGARTAKQRHEVNHQLHYMQRMLVPCMEVIQDSIPLYQAFTAPEVYGYMWSLTPACRDNRIYHEILSRRAPELLDIPWARTGRAYLDSSGSIADQLTKNNNLYGRWLRMSLRAHMRELVLSEEIERLRIFNMRALEVLLRHSESGNNDKATQLQELLAWVASLAECASRYGIRGAADSMSGVLRGYVDGKILSLIQAIAFERKIELQNYVRSWRA